jgi:hypothetical protein
MRLPLVLIFALGCHGRATSSLKARAALPTTAARPVDANQGGGRGANKWKDTGVYLDGKPIGVLGFGELPITLKPIFIEQEKSAEMRPGSHDPGYVVIKERRYRFTDYLKSMGIDISRIREFHVMGPRPSETIIATAADLKSKRAAGFQFRFGSGGVGGKAIPVVPNGFANDKSPDKISSVMIYIDKKPPTLGTEGLELDGELVSGIPYAREPLHGGVRVYKDDRLVASLHRRDVVEQDPISTDEDGTQHFGLFRVLRTEGVDLRGVTEAWVIRDERRKEKLDGAALADVTFELGEKKQNAVYLGKNKLQAQVIALHSKPVHTDQLPVILSTESDD